MKRLKVITRLFGLLALLSLVGCASLNSEFNCPAGKGVGCKSIHEVNQMVNDDLLGEAENEQSKPIKPATPSLFSFSYPTKPRRTKDQVLSVWIAPYEDKHGNYHDASTVHTVAQTGGWLTTNKGLK